MNIELQDKLYTSTQVADILGVSLRTLYRYMEDQRIKSMKTASGRHRFTRDQILEFLNADQSQSQPQAQVQQQQQPQAPAEDDFVVTQPQEQTIQQQSPPPARSPFQEQQPEPQTISSQVQTETQPVSQPEPSGSPFGISQMEEQKSQPEPEVQSVGADQNIRYYKSEYSDLIELAKKVKESANSRDLEFAFTLFAGLSLHFSIKPFTVLHFYVNPEDMQIWKDQLRLVPEQKRESANVGLIVNTDIVFVPTKEIGGFKVVEDKVLLKDLSSNGEEALLGEFRQHLSQS